MEQVSSPPQKRKKKNKIQEAPLTTTETVKPNGRNWTLAIAVPVSFLDSATSPEMMSYFAGCLLLHNDKVCHYNIYFQVN